MDEGLYLETLYRSVQEYNVLPLTSACAYECIFCSHRFQPQGVKTFSPGHIKTEVIFDLIDYLNESRKIVIGESASRIEEGEPFLHSEWRKILFQIRQQYPRTLCQITTAGTLLTADDIKFLSRMRPLKIFLSLNCISPHYRRRYLGDNTTGQISSLLENLSHYGVSVEGSILALPKLTGWQEISRTLKFLDEYPCVQAVRILEPGYTDEIDKNLKQKLRVDSESLNFRLEKWQSNLSISVYTEPSHIKSLKAKIMGVVDSSPADKIGLKKGDIITKIAGKNPFSRVEAFDLFKRYFSRGENFSLRILRNESNHDGQSSFREEKEFLIKPSEIKSNYEYIKEWNPGMIMAYDMPSKYLGKIISKTPSEGKVLLISAPRAANRLKLLIEKLDSKSGAALNFELHIINPDFFGGNIQCAGLLVNRDILANKQKILSLQPDLVLLPGIMFNHREQDLNGQKLSEIQSELQIPVKII